MRRRILLLLLACACLLAAFPVFAAAESAAGTESPADPAWEARLAEAREKYNAETVNIYLQGRGRNRKGKINVRFYVSRKEKERTICISESLQINDEAEMTAILELVAANENYDEEVFGSVSFMRAEWIAHNLAHEMATGSDQSKMWIEAVTGEKLSRIVSSSKELDLSPVESLTEKQLSLYRLVEALFSH